MPDPSRLVVALAAALAATACGSSADERREVARAEAERRFGRPAAEAAERAREQGPDRLISSAGSAPAPGSAPPAPVETNESRGNEDAPTSVRPTAKPEIIEPETPVARAVDPDAIMAGADAAYSGLSSLRAAFVQRVDVPLLDRTSQGHGVWYQEGRDRFRMDFVDPPEDLFVADGEFLWLWQPSANPNQVIKSALAGGTQAGGADVLGRILSEARASYDAVYDGTAIVSGE